MAERVALLDTINPAAKQTFEAESFSVVEFSKALSTSELSELTEGIHLLGVRSGPEVPAQVIESGKTLQAIGCFCVGTNHVNHESANNNGVAIFNATHENTRSVAEHVIASVFGLMRRIPEHSREMHDGRWTKTDESSYEVRGKTIGIVGYGSIGSQVSVLAEAIGMSVNYYDPRPQSPPHGRATRKFTLEDVLEASDVITLHVPGGRNTRNLIGQNAISLMRPGAYIINTSRGDVVNYEAVAEAINEGHIGGIAADVFEDEPSNKGDRFEHVLRDVNQAILTPHIAGSTIEAQQAIGREVAIRMLAYLATGSTTGSVNLPELSLDLPPKGVTRLLNIHRNEPGVIAKISNILGEARLNVVSTKHDVRGDIGYVAFDIDGKISDEDYENIALLPASRRSGLISR